ncbi:MAG: bifunctional glycosyltransferase family 2/GtrA family protein [Acidobacteriaceae bacterium]|nr:bifunctional glycosyltransferase family 2/GtrA family protein [Acidobacteriaceae bacterium]
MEFFDQIAVLIPAWKPEPQLVELVRALRAAGFATVLLVDDGNEGDARELLERAAAEGASVVRHAVNLGKGRALKTGFNALLNGFPEISGVVTADADGQHRVEDICAVAAAFAGRTDRVVLGCRSFAKDVPMRSRFGNRLTRIVFRLANGSDVSDTQTGLRAIPRALLLELMALEGERYEYEMRVLAHICRAYERPREVPIATVYLEGNRSSHFDPVRDSMRIYFVLLRFYSSSLLAAAVDLVGFSVTYSLSRNLLLSVVVGRLSSLLNYALNRGFVFRTKGSLISSLGRYYALALGLGTMSYVLLSLAVKRLGWPVVPAKIAIEVLLSLLSFAAQRTFVFRRTQEG